MNLETRNPGTGMINQELRNAGKKRPRISNFRGVLLSCFPAFLILLLFASSTFAYVAKTNAQIDTLVTAGYTGLTSQRCLDIGNSVKSCRPEKYDELYNVWQTNGSTAEAVFAASLFVGGSSGGGGGTPTPAPTAAPTAPPGGGGGATYTDTDLAGGTALAWGTSYHDNFAANRTLTFTGTPGAGGPSTVLRANVTAACTLTIPSSYRIGAAGNPITSLSLMVGNHEFSWVYSNGQYWLGDSVEAVIPVPANNNSPGTANSMTSDATALYFCYATDSWAKILYTTTTFGVASTPTPTPTPPPAGPTTLISDTFTAADNTAIDGRAPSPTTVGTNAWASLLGAASQHTILANAGHWAGGNLNLEEASVVDSGASNVTVSVSSIATGILNGTDSKALVFRASDSSNYWIAQGTGSGHNITKVVAGVATVLVSDTLDPGHFAGQAFSVVTSGSSITFKIGGVTQLTATDAFNSTATKHGVYSKQRPVDLDDFQVTSP